MHKCTQEFDLVTVQGMGDGGRGGYTHIQQKHQIYKHKKRQHSIAPTCVQSLVGVLLSK